MIKSGQWGVIWLHEIHYQPIRPALSLSVVGGVLNNGF
jgi:hypothetical protein